MNEYPPDENPPCCPACGTPWQDHDGASQTCKALSAARARIAELEAKCERLQAVVDRLPKTADGVPVTPDMIVYGTDEPWIVQEIDNEMCVGFQARDGVGRCPANHLYSTESAALAAKESTNGT